MMWYVVAGAALAGLVAGAYLYYRYSAAVIAKAKASEQAAVDAYNRIVDKAKI